jgi:hypothetical protein
MSRTNPTIIRRATTKPNILRIPTYSTSCLRSVAPPQSWAGAPLKDTLPASPVPRVRSLLGNDIRLLCGLHYP